MPTLELEGAHDGIDAGRQHGVDVSDSYVTLARVPRGPTNIVGFLSFLGRLGSASSGWNRREEAAMSRDKSGLLHRDSRGRSGWVARFTRSTWIVVLSGLWAVVFIASTGQPAGATGNLLQLNRTQGLAAQAFFTSTDGTVETFFFVNASVSDRQTASARPNSFAQAVASLGQIDTSTGQSIFFATCMPSGTTPSDPRLPEGALVVDPSLSSASLSAAFICDSGNVFGVAVDIQWMAPGPPETRHTTLMINEPGFHLNAVFEGVFQFDARAVGVVTDRTTNFTPEPSDQAPIFRFGEEQILIR
jgi:hypothetical protein